MQAVKTDTQKPSALYLRIDDLNTDKYNRAKRVLDIFDGRTPVIFYLTDTKRKVKAPSSMWVDNSNISLVTKMWWQNNQKQTFISVICNKNW